MKDTAVADTIRILGIMILTKGIQGQTSTDLPVHTPGDAADLPSISATTADEVISENTL